MTLAQFVIIRTQLGGTLKLTLMSKDQTEATYRGGALFILWKIMRHLARLRPVTMK